MLAGPRKKQKISADPRNKQWVDDSNKFGLRLMQKMGWSNGKGLGVNMDGKTENVKVVLKSDTKGLGFSNKEEDNWIAHQDDFNDILSQLHQEHTNGEEVTMVTPKSIEERSKISRRRVHYKKFTQGKDLANRSVNDMNCILGKRSGSSTPNSTSAPTSDNEDDDSMVSHGVRTVVNSVTVQDYFAQKMSQMKKAKVTNSDCAEGNSPQTGDFPAVTDDEREIDDTDKGNRKKEQEDATEMANDQKTLECGGGNDAKHLEGGVADGDRTKDAVAGKRKKKKRKKKDIQGNNALGKRTENENGFDMCVDVSGSGMYAGKDDGATVEYDENIETSKMKRKKKKKKGQKY